jgi:hypothetical protein
MVSDATVPNLLSKLPIKALNSWANLNAFINVTLLPSVSWCSSLSIKDIANNEASTSTVSAKRFGVDEKTAKAMDKLCTKYKFAEDITGVNDEAKLCLRRCQKADWGRAHDYAACIGSIVQREASFQLEHPGGAELRVEAYFSGSDVMSGKRGQEYFEQCWRQQQCRGRMSFTSKTYPKANHDSILIDYQQGALRDAFDKVVQCFSMA